MIYGYQYTDPVYESVDYDQMISFIAESELVIEDTTALTLSNRTINMDDSSDNSGSDSSEKVKKTVIEKIKELWGKFVNLIKTQFTKLAGIIHDFYMEHNTKDNIFSKFKDIVTYDNIMKCKDKGWVGIPKTIFVIGDICTAKDSYFFKVMDRYVEFSMDDVDKIVASANLEQAKDNYDKLLEKIKNSKYTETPGGMRLGKSISTASNEFYDLGEMPYFVFIDSSQNHDEDHYYPNKSAVDKCKYFAEKGQGEIKKIKDYYKHFIKNVQDQKTIDLSNMKTSKGKDESSKINALYFKARYQVSSYFLKVYTSISKATIEVIKAQYNSQLKLYVLFLKTIKQYKVA